MVVSYFSNGAWFINDLGTANGTFANGGRVKRRDLNHGPIQVGQTWLVFQVGV